MYDAMAMACMQLVNRLIDLGKLVISEKHLGFPETYSDIFKILAQNNLITTAKELLEFREHIPKIREMVERLKTCFS